MELHDDVLTVEEVARGTALLESPCIQGHQWNRNGRLAIAGYWYGPSLAYPP
jgi:hypothetical protein